MENEEILQRKFDKIKTTLLQNDKPVLMQSEFNSIMKEVHIEPVTIKAVKKYLIQNEFIKTATLKSEGYKDIERIEVPDLKPTPYHYAASLRNEAYLSHSSAVNLLGLTQQIPKIIYVNKEQSPKKQSEDPLSQEAIDRAFKNQQRRSKYIFKIDGRQIILLSGKSTNNAGVEIDPNLNLPRTCLERTLIDITVRPKYAGGVFQVLEAYKSAKTNIDYEKLLFILEKLNYKYPYHQSIGFYLEKAGEEAVILNKFKNMGIDFNFYLDYSMASPQLNQSWRVYYPLGI